MYRQIGIQSSELFSTNWEKKWCDFRILLCSFQLFLLHVVMTLGPALQIFIYANIAEGSVNSRRVVPEIRILPPFIIYLNQNCIGQCEISS